MRDDPSQARPPGLPHSLPPPLMPRASTAAPEPATRCANCDRPIDGEAQRYCPACGQPTPAQRIGWRFLGREIANGVLPADRGFLHSLRRLFWKPGHFIRGYIHGRRAGFTKPQIMVTMTAAMLLLWSRFLLGSDPFPEVGNASGGAAAFEQALTRWANSNVAVFNLLLRPVQAAAFKLVFRRTGGFNYPEWLATTALLIAQANVLWALLLPLQKWMPGAMAIITLVIVGCNTISLVQLFDVQSAWKTFWRSLAGYALYLLSYLLILSVITVVAMAVLGYRA